METGAKVLHSLIVSTHEGRFGIHAVQKTLIGRNEADLLLRRTRKESRKQLR
jgi:hypothetical protein